MVKRHECRAPPSAKLLFSEAFDKVDVTLRLGFETAQQIGVGQSALIIQETVDARHKDPDGIDEGIAIAKNLLELLNGPECAPDTGGKADKTHRALFEAVGKFQHVDEIFQDAGHAAVVLRRDNDEAVGFEDGLRKGMKRRRFLGVGRRRKNFRRQFAEIDDLQPDAERGEGFFDVMGDFGRVVIRAIGADDECQHEANMRESASARKRKGQVYEPSCPGPRAKRTRLMLDDLNPADHGIFYLTVLIGSYDDRSSRGRGNITKDDVLVTLDIGIDVVAIRGSCEITSAG